MGLLSSLSRMFSASGKAASLYKRGMKKAKQRDLEGAIADYSAVLEMKSAPANIRAMSQLNRALAYSTERDYPSAKADLDAVLASPGTPPDVRAAAQEKLARLIRRMGKSD